MLLQDVYRELQREMFRYLYGINLGPTVGVESISPVGLVIVTVEETGRSVSIPDHIVRRIKIQYHTETGRWAKN